MDGGKGILGGKNNIRKDLIVGKEKVDVMKSHKQCCWT